jgi:hypothetical protein
MKQWTPQEIVQRAVQLDPSLANAPFHEVLSRAVAANPGLESRIVAGPDLSMEQNREAVDREASHDPANDPVGERVMRGLADTSPLAPFAGGLKEGMATMGKEAAETMLQPIIPTRAARSVKHGLEGALQIAKGDVGGGLETASQDVPIVGSAVHDIRKGDIAHLVGSTGGNIMNAVLASRLMPGGGAKAAAAPEGISPIRQMIARNAGTIADEGGVVKGVSRIIQQAADPSTIPAPPEPPVPPAQGPDLPPLTRIPGVDPTTGVKGASYDVPVRGQFYPTEMPPPPPVPKVDPLRAIQTEGPGGEAGTLFDRPAQGQFYPRPGGKAAPGASQGASTPLADALAGKPKAAAVGKAPKAPKAAKVAPPAEQAVTAPQAVDKPITMKGKPASATPKVGPRGAGLLEQLLKNAVEQDPSADATVGVARGTSPASLLPVLSPRPPGPVLSTCWVPCATGCKTRHPPSRTSSPKPGASRRRFARPRDGGRMEMLFDAIRRNAPKE